MFTVPTKETMDAMRVWSCEDIPWMRGGGGEESSLEEGWWGLNRRKALLGVVSWRS